VAAALLVPTGGGACSGEPVAPAAGALAHART
jgi:hypothetical protein